MPGCGMQSRPKLAENARYSRLIQKLIGLDSKVEQRHPCHSSLLIRTMILRIRLDWECI